MALVNAGESADTFPLFSKICVNGESRHPLYQWLIAEQPQALAKVDGTLRTRLADRQLLPANETDIMWNFEKFLVNKQGEVVARFMPDVPPQDAMIVNAITAELAK